MVFQSLGLEYNGKQIKILDQQLLPHKEEWVDVTDVEDMVEAIKKLKVRGAPMIAIAASFCLGHLAKENQDFSEWMTASQKLYEARPTAVNLMNAIDKLRACAKNEGLNAVEAKVKQLFTEDQELCKKIGSAGAELIEKGDRILTYCNTGGLATAGIGTALGVIQTSHEQGKNISVYVPETRPLLQGGRLTAWELGQLGVSYSLICDNMCAHLMSIGEIDKVIVGADRIVGNGDFANKIGTYNLAVLAHYHKIPFYVAAPSTTIDKMGDKGENIPIELRKSGEVKGVKTSYGELEWAPSNASCYNPAFDVTPHQLVTAWIIDGEVWAEFTSNRLQEI